MTAYTINIISDGTGETAATMIRAALVQYHDFDIKIVRNKNVRTETQVRRLVDEIAKHEQSMIIYTVVSPTLRDCILELCMEKGILSVDLLGPLLTQLDAFFGAVSEQKAGLLRAVDDRYFRRIEAIEYTVKHDDGKCLTDLDQADVLLVGLSRTSKTPLSIFLSHKGWKVVNIPIVLGRGLPEELQHVDQKKIVALTIAQDSLHRIRKKRLENFGQDPGGEYASLKHILKEIDYAEEIYRKNRRWPVINVTDRSLEETAAEITKIVSARRGLPDNSMF